MPIVDADQVAGLEVVTGFLQRLAHDRVEQAFACLDMASRLVNDDIAAGGLFDEKKAAQAAAYFLLRAGGRLEVLKLMKLLYLAERRSFEKYGEPME